MLNRIAPLLFVAIIIVTAGCAQQSRRVATTAPSATVTRAPLEVAHVLDDDGFCACEQVQCYERVRKGCRATCAENEEPQCSCEARCTVMGRLVARNHCECKHLE
jgi:hypothetical protein